MQDIIPFALLRADGDGDNIALVLFLLVSGCERVHCRAYFETKKHTKPHALC